MKCKKCGGNDAAWTASVDSFSGVQDGRLRMHDVHPILYLGCPDCLETLEILRGDQIGAHVTSLTEELKAYDAACGMQS